MSYLSGGSLGGDARAAGSTSAPEVALNDPGAQRVMRLFTDSPGLTLAMHAVSTAVAGSVHGNNSEMLAALTGVVDRSREVSAQVRLVHCQTQDGRDGQHLALHALALAEQAGSYLRAGVSSAETAKTKADLSQGVKLAQASLHAGAQAVKLLSK